MDATPRIGIGRRSGPGIGRRSGPGIGRRIGPGIGRRSGLVAALAPPWGQPATRNPSNILDIRLS
jgi:hypothetical protein